MGNSNNARTMNHVPDEMTEKEQMKHMYPGGK